MSGPGTNPADSDCAKPPNALNEWKDWNQAGAQAYYACRYFASIRDTNYWRNIIAGVQAAVQYYFADKQYDIASRAQDRLDAVSNIELDRSGKLFAQFEKQISQEDAQLARAVERLNIPEPDYNAIRLRVTASVIRQFTEPKRKIEQCYPVSCMEARCNALGKIATEEAKTIASEVEQAYQKERSLYEIRLATARAELAEVLKFGRGALNAANAALEGASRAAIQAGSINPYSGYIQAVNSTAQTLQGITTQEALSFRGMGANVGQASNQTLARTTTTDGITTGITNRVHDDWQVPTQVEQLPGWGVTGTPAGEINNDSRATQVSNPMDKIA